jgi:hypothetical protein
VLFQNGAQFKNGFQKCNIFAFSLLVFVKHFVSMEEKFFDRLVMTDPSQNGRQI